MVDDLPDLIPSFKSKASVVQAGRALCLFRFLSYFEGSVTWRAFVHCVCACACACGPAVNLLALVNFFRLFFCLFFHVC